MNGHPLEVSLEELIRGDHERCSNPRCRSEFPLYEGKLVRVRGLDAKWYCDSVCASGPYLTERLVKL